MASFAGTSYAASHPNDLVCARCPLHFLSTLAIFFRPEAQKWCSSPRATPIPTYARLFFNFFYRALGSALHPQASWHRIVLLTPSTQSIRFQGRKWEIFNSRGGVIFCIQQERWTKPTIVQKNSSIRYLVQNISHFDSSVLRKLDVSVRLFPWSFWLVFLNIWHCFNTVLYVNVVGKPKKTSLNFPTSECIRETHTVYFTYRCRGGLPLVFWVWI